MPFKFYKQESSKEETPVKVRETLNKMGIDNDRIGYNEKDKTVTLDGKTLLTPSYLDEGQGVSYAPESVIQNSITQFYKNSTNPVVRVSDAFSDSAGKYGISADALTYGNGVVSIGGKPLDILYIDDEGKSWAYRDTVENSVRALVQNSGVKSPNDLLREYQEEYLNQAETLMKKLNTQKEFQYDPDSDPVFQAYRSKYLTEGSRAGRDAMADYAALTGGQTNSAAVTAAAQAEQYYAKKITDVLPELAMQAYERYRDAYEDDLSLLESMVDLYDRAYTHAQDANTLQRENLNSSYESNVERDREAELQNWETLFRTQKATQNSQTQELNDLKAEQTRQEMAENSLDMERVKTQIAGLSLDNAQKETYLKYYESLLKAELEGERMDQLLTQAQITGKNLDNIKKSIWG